MVSSISQTVKKLEDAVFARRPVLARVIEQYGDCTMGVYVDTFKATGLCGAGSRGATRHAGETIQSADDFVAAAVQLAEKILGPGVATKLEKRLRESPVILTANHHGPDFSHITLQGSINFSLQEAHKSVLPIFAFGDIPLNNWISWPRGILVSDRAKLGLFPDAMKHAMVSVTPRFTRQMVEAALGQLDQPYMTDVTTEGQRRAVKTILEENYLDSAVLALDDYSEQSTYISAKLWRRLFAEDMRGRIPDMAYLEMERVAVQVIERDIMNDASLLYACMFDVLTRDSIVKSLDGESSCWYAGALQKGLRGSGTMFFWGVDEKKRYFPLVLEGEGRSCCLVGADGSGGDYRFDFTPDALVGYLRDGKLLPSLFTVFTSVAFARGFVCCGGVMQTDYLTTMRDGVVRALVARGRSTWAEQVAAVKTDTYITGMYGVVCAGRDSKMAPASTIDIVENGGLTAAHVMYLRDHVTVHRANTLGLRDMYTLIYRAEEQDLKLAELCMDDIYSTGGFQKSFFPV